MNVLLSGVSKGLGLEICKQLLQGGHVVYGLSRSHSAGLKTLEEVYGDKLKWMSYDLANATDVHITIFKEWIGNATPIHAFINNAAQAYDDIVTNLKLEPLEQMYRVNVFTPMMMTRSAIRNMLLHNVAGSIVHVSSISVHTGYKGLAMYASTKGALEAFSKNTAREWGEKGIRSNALVAGFMETEMSSALDDDKKARIYARTSLKKAVSIESCAQTICFLISDAAASISGQNIHVDNGTI